MILGNEHAYRAGVLRRGHGHRLTLLGKTERHATGIHRRVPKQRASAEHDEAVLHIEAPRVGIRSQMNDRHVCNGYAIVDKSGIGDIDIQVFAAKLRDILGIHLHHSQTHTGRRCR